MFSPALMRFAALTTSYVLALAGGATLGYRYADAQGAARLAQCARDRSEQQARALSLAALRVQAARAAGDAAVNAEAARRLAAEQQTTKVKHGIQRLAVGRPCLSGELVGVLNRAPGIDADAVRGTPGGAADAVAGAAEVGGKAPSPQPLPQGGGIMDDADVAGWIADAARLYDACRGRIDALRTWTQGVMNGQQENQ